MSYSNKNVDDNYNNNQTQKEKKPKQDFSKKLLKYERNGAGYEFIPLLIHTLRRYAEGKKGYNENRLDYSLKEIPNARQLIREALKVHDAIPAETKQKLFSDKYAKYDLDKAIPPKEIADVMKRGQTFAGKNVAVISSVLLPKKKGCCCDDDSDDDTPPVPKNRYEISFEHLYCIDESDPEWLGSDEPYMVFAMITEEMVLNGTSAIAKNTPVYEDVDDGDRRPTSGSEDLRLYGFAGAANIESNLLITGNCFEHDLGDVHGTTDKVRAALTSVAGTAAGAGGIAGWIVAGAAVIAIGVSYLVDLWGGDDQIGDTQVISLTQADADNLTSGSTTSTFSPMHFNGGDDNGIYDGYITLRRV